MSLPKSWTTVTPLSKTIAMILFILLPFIGFSAGMRYQQRIKEDSRYELEHKLNKSINEKEISKKHLWDIYHDYGIKILYPTKYTPKINNDKTIKKSTSISFRKEMGGSLGINILLYPYNESLEVYKTQLTKTASVYKPTNIRNTTFSGYPAIMYSNFVPKNIVVIVNGILYHIEIYEVPENPIEEIETSLSTIQFDNKMADLNEPNQVACTQDAKDCGNGVWVGRTGPNCEFYCPKE